MGHGVFTKYKSEQIRFCFVSLASVPVITGAHNILVVIK